MLQIKISNDNCYENKRVMSKILKLDESNPYGFAVIKPLLNGCIKEEQLPSWRKFDLLLERVYLDDAID